MEQVSCLATYQSTRLAHNRSRLFLPGEHHQHRRSIWLFQGQQRIFRRDFLSRVAICFVASRPAALAGPLARCLAGVAVGWNSRKSYRSPPLRARDRFSSFRSPHSLRASLAGLQCGGFVHHHRGGMFYHSFFLAGGKTGYSRIAVATGIGPGRLGIRVWSS